MCFYFVALSFRFFFHNYLITFPTHVASLIKMQMFTCVCILFVLSKQTHNPASSQASSFQSDLPAANESQHFPTSDTRAKTVSEPLPHHTPSSAVSSPPSSTATNNHSAAPKDAGHHGSCASSSSELDCSQSINGVSGAPPKVSKSEDDTEDSPQTKCPSAGTEGHTENKEQYRSKPVSRGSEKQPSRDRERDRPYSDYSRNKERHYRDRSKVRESDGDRHWYSRDYRDHHRSHKDRLIPHERNYREWDAERRWHSRDHDRSYRRSYYYTHYHRHSDVDYERRGYNYTHREESQSHWRWQQDRQEYRGMKEKRGAWDRDSYYSKGRSSSPEKSKSKGSSPRASQSTFYMSPKREDERIADSPRKERDDSSEGHRSRKHKKSKKKKSKDKDRHHKSGQVLLFLVS